MKIAWKEHGSGEPLLLIQGLGYGRWGWDPVVPGLAERFRVLTFDNRGIGDSDKPEGPYTAREMAADALQVLDEAAVTRAHVLGAHEGHGAAPEAATRHARAEHPARRADLPRDVHQRVELDGAHLEVVTQRAVALVHERTDLHELARLQVGRRRQRAQVLRGDVPARAPKSRARR